KFQGCPTIALTRGGRIWTGWYSGGVREPHMDNYEIITYSDDGGKSFRSPYLIIPSDKERLVHALDPELWTAPDGRLFLFWIQENVVPTTPENLARTEFPPIKDFTGFARIDGFMFTDFLHSVWVSVCDEPDAEKPVFSEPKCVCDGFIRCKPTVLANGDYLIFPYDQLQHRYAYALSHDGGKTFERHFGGKKVETRFDEGMAYVKNDGSIRMFARTSVGVIAESYSYDGGKTWTDGAETDIKNPNTRFFISRTPSGRVMLVNNDDPSSRTNMTVYLSDDDGVSWKYKRCIDSRKDLSYPDVDSKDGRVYLVYDRERIGAKEILFTTFTEDDIIGGAPINISVISKPQIKEIEILGENRHETFTKERVACRGIVARDGKILASKMEKSDFYMIPGGGIEGDETPDECCVREIAEETGIVAKAIG
ncbi:MAG: exo-alpha-sialidase, partial [Clostridiales bacterium]|nr:exo-alpha-sialidase [Clostridiales bacterium]